jgi:hypothetical protein
MATKIPPRKKTAAKAKGRPGRKPFDPTPAQRRTVEVMSVAGLDQGIMSRCLGVDGIDEKTLRKYFRDELDLGKAKLDTRITDTIIRQALAGNTVLLIWYSKARMGWAERSLVEMTGKNGGPQQHEHVVHSNRYDDMTLDELRAAVSARSAGS